MLAPDGRCKAFDARADGFGRGEGCGIVVLKRLRDATAARDRILAVIRGSAVNQDGRSNGLTAPNGPSQVDVIRAALADAGVGPGAVGYVEAHGTGTPLGDPIEARALATAFGAGRQADRPLRIGSVKTNIGHLESAAGIAGLMKVVLALRHRQIPPSLHLTEPSPRIPWHDLPLDIPTTLTPWPATDGPQLAGVSSFGFSGTNAHVVLEAAPELAPAETLAERPRHLLAFSARTEPSLHELAGRVRARLASDPDVALADVAHTLATGRNHHAHRLAVVAATSNEAVALLDRYLGSDDDDERLAAGTVSSLRSPPVAFLFTGHGAQRADMGRSLYDSHQGFRAAIDRCADLLGPLMDQPLHVVLFADGDGMAEKLLGDMTYAQPAVFAVEYALAELWRSWGVEPSVVVGHSVGEYVAATVAGALDLADGLKLVAARGRLMASLPADGEMATVLAPESRVTEVLGNVGDGSVSIAAVNGPSSVAISGPAVAVRVVLDELRRVGVQVRPLAIPVAAHSPQVEPILDEFEAVAATVEYRAPRIDVVSGMTGALATGTDLTSARYWRLHLRNPVRFAEAFQTVFDSGVRTFVEAGPHPTLLSMGRRIVPEDEATWLPSLRTEHDDWEQILGSVARLYVHGVRVDWTAFDGPYGPRRIALPTYPFARERYWAEPRRRSAAPGGGHPLLGRPIMSPALAGWVCEAELAPDAPAFLAGRRVLGTVVVAPAAHAEMALAAARQRLQSDAVVVHGLELGQALALPDDDTRVVQVVVGDEPGGASVQVVSRDPDDRRWQHHATGRIAAAPPDGATPPLDVPAVQARCSAHATGSDVYRRLGEAGVAVDPELRGLQDVWLGAGEALGRVELPDGLRHDARRYGIHPALLDACLQVVGAVVAGDDTSSVPLVAAIEQLRVTGLVGPSVWSHAGRRAGEPAVGDVRIYDADGGLVAEALGVRMTLAGPNELRAQVERPAEDWRYGVVWEPSEVTPDDAPPAPPRTWVVVGDGAGLADALVEHLAASGRPVVQLPGASPSLGHELAALAATATDGLRVVHVGALDARPLDASTPEDLDRDVTASVASVVDVVQAVVAGGTEAEIWLVTRGAQDAGGAVAAPEQAPVWGLGRVVSLEHPDVWGGLIDLDPGVPVDPAVVLAEIRDHDADDQVAWRDGRRLVPRLTRVVHRPAAPIAWRHDGSYLVTGGLGGLGLKVLDWMASAGAGTIVLVGRRGVPARATWDGIDPASRAGAQVAAIRAAEAAGATVEVVAADVADRGLMQALVSRFGADLPPLHGVIHAAADLSHHAVASMPVGAVASMLRPKVAGTWLLHELTLDQPLDFFVSFSSTTSLWGSRDIGHYAAANVFLDVFAHHRRALGLPALTVNWGVWDEMRVASAQGQEFVRRSGLNPMRADAALRLLGDLLGDRLDAEVTIASVDWERLTGVYESRRARPFFSRLRPVTPVVASPGAGRPELLDRLDGVATARRRHVAMDYLRAEVARTLGIGVPADVATDQGLFEMGMDSLMSLELKKRIEASVGTSLPATLTFNYPTIDALAGFLVESVVPAPAAPPDDSDAADAAEIPAPAAVSTSTDDLTEDDLAALLSARLAKLHPAEGAR